MARERAKAARDRRLFLPVWFVENASALANDLERLAQLRRTLRDRMTHSPLMDGPRYARNMEAAYRDVWRSFCASG